MKFHRHHHPRRAFTLTELVVVLSVFGVIIGAIWGYAQQARQSTKIEQSIEAITEIVESTRSSYISRVSITGGIATVMPIVTGSTGFPIAFMNPQQTTCSGVPGNYANNPWGNPTNDPCGTLAVCAWTIGSPTPASNNTNCATPAASASSQYFAIEFSQLDYGSCVSLVETLSSSQPTGLKDVFINGLSAGITLSGGLPVKPSIAAGNCQTTNGAASITPNTVDFIYSLRAPLS